MLFPIRDDTPSRSFPAFTILLILINVFVFILTYSAERLDIAVNRFGFTPHAMVSRPVVAVTSTFLHAGWIHLLSNIWFLWIFGDSIEDRFGRIRYLLLYLISGVTGNLTHGVFSGFESELPVIGASGAVAGVMGSYLVCYPLAKVKSVFFLIFWPIILKVPALLLLGLWMVGEFIGATAFNPSDNVAHWAHVGGFAFGVLWTWGRRAKFYRARGWWW